MHAGKGMGGRNHQSASKRVGVWWEQGGGGPREHRVAAVAHAAAAMMRVVKVRVLALMGVVALMKVVLALMKVVLEMMNQSGGDNDSWACHDGCREEGGQI